MAAGHVGERHRQESMYDNQGWVFRRTSPADGQQLVRTMMADCYDIQENCLNLHLHELNVHFRGVEEHI